MKRANPVRGSLRAGPSLLVIVLVPGLVAWLGSGCATTARVGTAFHAMTPEQHIATACTLDRKAAALEARFDPDAWVPQPPAAASGETHRQPPGPPGNAEYVNATERFAARARALRREAARHLAAAGRGGANPYTVCVTEPQRYRGFGGNWWF